MEETRTRRDRIRDHVRKHSDAYFWTTYTVVVGGAIVAGGIWLQRTVATQNVEWAKQVDEMTPDEALARLRIYAGLPMEANK